MGWAISSSGEPSVWHSGDNANFHSDMAILPAQDLGMVVLMNVNGNLSIATNAQGVIAERVQQLLLPGASVRPWHVGLSCRASFSESWASSSSPRGWAISSMGVESCCRQTTV